MTSRSVFGLTRRQMLASSVAMAGVTSYALMSEAIAQVTPLHCVPPTPGTWPTPFVPTLSQAARVRKSAFELNPDETSKLKSAYDALRRFYQDHPDDPRGWYGQGIMHCWYCSGALDSIAGPEIHGGWFFLPWHRAYLHFHEQILGHLIGDSSFALPYWDWDTPGRNRFPPAYMDPPDQTNPLFDPFRAVGSEDRIPDILTGPATMKRVMGQANFGLFAGVSEGASGRMGAIEGAPHGGVHLWVTNPTQFIPPRINMGVLGTAAFDPVFYAHHANIDRLWAVWLNTQADPPHANPPEIAAEGEESTGPNWWNQLFHFYDQRRQWTQIEVRQVIDHETSLRYRYQQPMSPPATPIVLSSVAAASRGASKERSVVPVSKTLLDISVPPGGAVLTPDPQTLRAVAPPPAAAALREATEPSSSRRLILRIDGVEVPSDRAALVNVFLNHPEATAATPTSDPGFVGSIVLVPSTTPNVGHVHVSVRNFSFDVTDKLGSEPAAPGAELTVTLVPFQGNDTRPSDIQLRYRRVYLVTE
jgi:polyphenol oxidase